MSGPGGIPWEDLVEAESERQLADPPATWREHWFDHRQLPLIADSLVSHRLTCGHGSVCRPRLPGRAVR